MKEKSKEFSLTPASWGYSRGISLALTLNNLKGNAFLGEMGGGVLCFGEGAALNKTYLASLRE